jgi:hypothetical protein
MINKKCYGKLDILNIELNCDCNKEDIGKCFDETFNNLLKSGEIKKIE